MVQWEIEELVCSYLGLDPGLILEFIKLTKVASTTSSTFSSFGWRHACFTLGVTVLDVESLILPDGSGVVFFTYCSSCGSLYYFVDKE